MKYKRDVLIDGFLMAVAVGALIPAMKWPFRTALFPITIGIPVFLTALTDLLLNVFQKPKREAPVKKGMIARPETPSETIDPALALRRTLSIFAWIIGFFVLILLAGFAVAAPLYVFLYLKLQAREGWKLTFSLTASTFVFFYGLFVWILNTHFEEGWIVDGLRAMGMIG